MKSRNKKLVLAVAVMSVLALMVLLTSAGQGERAATAPIRIGVAGPHSGDLATFGLPTVNASRMVADRINEAGGINGRRIELIVEDELCQPEVAANTAAKLIGDGVTAIIGHICSGATFAVLETYLDSNLVSISPSATNPALTQSGDFPNFFRTIASDDAQARLQVDFVLDTMDARRIVILHDRGDYGRGLAEFARGFVEADGRGQVVLFDGITPGAVDYSAIIARVEAARPDVVMYGGYHPEASRLIGQMRGRGMTVPFISGDGVQDDAFIQTAGAAAEGVFATGPMDTADNPMAQDATSRHRERFGEDPGPFFMNGYAAAVALFAAIEAGGTDYDGIRNALRNNTVETPLGPIRFDERGDAMGVGFAVYQVQNGRYVELR
ncbi:MAG: branched-chain amino acid ABC transporter substrate-binding protein [Spirochaetaceae bacterium]|nr:MAG: branched-chain amino acid ABC transporter substrate-binding protein [Spirochaetaceae bacterium]